MLAIAFDDDFEKEEYLKSLYNLLNDYIEKMYDKSLGSLVREWREYLNDERGYYSLTWTKPKGNIDDLIDDMEREGLD